MRGVFAGCVCCQITGELITAVDEIHLTVQPDWLIIETTGLAVPSKVVNLLNDYCKCFDALRTIVLTDVSRWTELIEVAEPLIVSQLQAADVIIVNKVDLADEQTLQALEKELGLLNQKASICRLNAANDIETANLRELVKQ